ncbi:MAG: N-6 DNA methylase [Fretibacterium sp.]|nr:N-6 DNA methylase [Fretibacterium sp.]
MPYLLGITNLLLHGVDAPEFYHGNSLERNVRELDDEDKFDIILMNPPYGGTERRSVQDNFPARMRSSETAGLFMALATYHLKKGSRAAIIIPDGFLLGTDGPKVAIKKRLLEEFNLHTVVRLPAGVFSPYTSITTNLVSSKTRNRRKTSGFIAFRFCRVTNRTARRGPSHSIALVIASNGGMNAKSFLMRMNFRLLLKNLPRKCRTLDIISTSAATRQRSTLSQVRTRRLSISNALLTSCGRRYRCLRVCWRGDDAVSRCIIFCKALTSLSFKEG